MGKIRKKVLSGVLCLGFAGALCPMAIAYAGNTADTPYTFDLSYQQSSDTENRVKYDYTSSYVNCTDNTGTSIVQSNGMQMGEVYTWGPKYPVAYGSQYIDNWVMENRPRDDVSTYCFLRFCNEYYGSTIHTEGLWSPDSV
jgi:hypothetical protein